MPLRVTMASSCPERNHQANDIRIALEKRGAIVQFHKAWFRFEDPNGCGLFERLLSWFPRGEGLGRTCDFALKAGLPATDLLVCINNASLCAALPIALLRRPKFVYYVLEFDSENWLRIAIETAVCRLFSAVVLVPEENRAQLLRSRFGRRCNIHVLPNVPYLQSNVVREGRLKAYVSAALHHRDPTIILYSGSYQSYSRLETIVASSVKWPSGTCLALMITGGYPDELSQAVRASRNRAVIVPPVEIRELYGWIADADVGLLPYENDQEINVCYCAPQKLYDYLACGIPFIGSRRPTIEAVAQEFGCGLCIDMTDEAALTEAIKTLQYDDSLRGLMAARARKAHADKYHYEKYIEPVCSSLFARTGNGILPLAE